MHVCRQQHKILRRNATVVTGKIKTHGLAGHVFGRLASTLPLDLLIETVFVIVK